ncbi:MAG: ATP-binding protein [Elusimicrobia bacterium]|nr:ATP-binding protein [Elusimicrobiota bacterium]
MLTRWKIKDASTAKDKNRRTLLVKATWNDVQSLVKKLGPVCGRPKKEASDPEFNYSIVLHKLTDEALKGVEAVLKSVVPGRSTTTMTRVTRTTQSMPLPARAPTPLPAQAPTPLPVQPPTPLPAPAPAPLPAPQPEAPFAGMGAVPPPDQQAKAAPPPAGGPTPDNPFAGFGTQPLQFPRPTAHEPLSPPFVAAPGGGLLPDLMAAAHTPDPVPLGDEPPPAGLSLSKPPAPEPPAPAAPAVPAIAAPAPEPVPAPPKPRPGGTTSLPSVPPAAGPAGGSSEPLFGALRGLDTERTLDNMLVGSYNRFSHAAAMSLLTSPGTLYNPLLVWGGSGTGKTHLLNAVALRLQEQTPHETVWLTSGSALARAAGQAQASGRAAELIEFAAKARALVIDDLHMTGMAEHNADTLVKVIGAVLHASRQIVLSSLYAPRHLGSLEASLGLKTDKGHVVELKTPNDAAQQAIGEAALTRMGLAPAGEDKDVFARGLLKDFTMLDDHLRRISALGSLGPTGAPLGQFLREVFAPDAEAAPMSAEQVKGAMPAAPKAGKTALVLCHPAGAEAHADFLFARLGETAKARGWPFLWKPAAKVAYPVDPPHAAPYLLAEECLRSGAAAALVVGPPPGCDLAGQERPFRTAALRLLSEAQMACALVPFARVQDPKQALFAYLDLTPRVGGRA